MNTTTQLLLAFFFYAYQFLSMKCHEVLPHSRLPWACLLASVAIGLLLFCWPGLRKRGDPSAPTAERWVHLRLKLTYTTR